MWNNKENPLPRPFPLWNAIRRYRFSHATADLRAAFTVALLALPQSMTYALVAGLPPSVGLFAAIFGTIFTSTFGSSRHLITGCTNTVAILIQTAVADVLYTNFRDVGGEARAILAVQTTIQLTFLIGIIQITAGALRLGRLTQFVSRSVVEGYIVGTAVAVIVNQGFNFLGIPHPPGVRSLAEKAFSLGRYLHLAHGPTLVLGVVSLLLLLLLRRVPRRPPTAVLMLIIITGAVQIFGWSASLSPLYFVDEAGPHLNKIALLGDLSVGELTDFSPEFAIPWVGWGSINTLIPAAVAIAIMGMLETTSLAKSVAASSGQKLVLNQEIFGLGMGNLLSSLFGAMPSSGSPSRTYINYQAGAQTSFSGVFCGLIVALLLLLLSSAVNMIPQVALAALLLVTAFRMLNREHLRYCLSSTGYDAIVFSITLFSCMLFPLDTAFYIGIGLSITFHLNNAARPRLIEYAYSERNGLTQKEAWGPDEGDPRVRIISLEGEFFFGSVDMFQATGLALADDHQARVIVLNLRNALHVDASACLALKTLKEYSNRLHRHFLIMSVEKPVWRVFIRSGLIDEIGRENIFPLDEWQPSVSVDLAMKRAQECLREGEPGTDEIEEEFPTS